MTVLDVGTVRERLTGKVAELIESFDAFPQLDSTNNYLKARPPPTAGRFSVAIANHQTAGRGRQQRRWISAPGSSLCLSLGYSFQRMPADVPALTLALGVGVVRCLESLGEPNARLKWPNDLIIGERKLGGILTETQSRDRHDLSAIAGLGINVDLPDDISAMMQSEWAHDAISLANTMRDRPGMDELAAGVITALIETMLVYDREGFDAFRDRFTAVDWLAGRQVVVETPSGDISGIAAGIDASGALCLDTREGRQTILSGSIRRAVDDTVAV